MDGGMPRPAKRIWTRVLQTLRFRVVLWNVSVVVLTAIAVLIAVRVQVEFTLRTELDGVLLDELEEAAQEISMGAIESGVLRKIVDRETYGHKHLQEYVEVLSPMGETLVVNAGAPRDRPSPLGVVDDTPTTIGGYRIVKRNLARSDQSTNPTQSTGPAPPTRAIVVVGALASGIDEQMRTLDRIVALTAAVAMIIAPLVGYWLARKVIDPLGRMTSTAAKLHPEHLEERLPIRDTGDELDQLAITVNQLLDRIFTYLQEHRESLANAAHELRSPLAAIRSSVEVALNRGRTTEEYEELLESIIEQGAALEVLVNQLLLLSEMERDHLELPKDPVQLDQLVTRSVSMFQGVAEQKGVDLQIRGLRPLRVAGNRLHLREVVNNILDNAIKFTEKGGKVTVDVQEDEEHALAVLRITDSGIGIATADLAKVFDRFFRGDRSRSRDIPGTGLGLSICKSVVEAHGGTVAVQSPGVGTTFVVKLPVFKEDLSAADGDTGLRPV